MTGEDRCSWSTADAMALFMNCSDLVAENLVEMFGDSNTVPFITRYRRNRTDGMEADQVRRAYLYFLEMVEVRKKAEKYAKTFASKRVPVSVIRDVLAATTLDELDSLVKSYKPSGPKKLADAAREAGLGDVASDVLFGKGNRVDFGNFVNGTSKVTASLRAVQENVQHIVADEIWRMKTVQDWIRKQLCDAGIAIKSDAKKVKKNETNPDPGGTYANYYDKRYGVRHVQNYQVLAMQRGSAAGVLKVSVVVPDRIKFAFVQMARRCIHADQEYRHIALLQNAIDEVWTRFAEPFLERTVWSTTLKRAKAESVDVFAANLRNLLLLPPLLRHTILSVDPGFSHGCKVAVLGPTGSLLHTTVFYLNNLGKASDMLDRCLRQFGVTRIVVGNGTACRETHNFLKDFLQKVSRRHSQDVKLTIVSEAGASIYSAAPIAKEEFPNLDPNLVSAVNIARRMQDPLSELVKLDPKHLGVGSYQHSLSEKDLATSRDLVVEECVSFVGVDVNAASSYLLRRVAGLNAKLAENIVKRRSEKGAFRCRNELLSIAGIGEAKFKQAAGFLRVYDSPTDGSQPGPSSVAKVEDQDAESGPPKKKKRLAVSKSAKASSQARNLLDTTMVHPEDYGLAGELLSAFGFSNEDIGSTACLAAFASEGAKAKALGFNLGPDETVSLIVQALGQPPRLDCRKAFSPSRFNQTVPDPSSLKPGQILCGEVRNVVDFGAFVDIYAGRDGLVPKHLLQSFESRLGRQLRVGDYVKVRLSEIRSGGKFSLTVENLEDS